jgi:hypothetical protein
LIGLYLIWRLFIQTIMKCIRRFCKEQILFFEEGVAEADFYENVNFRSLRLIMKEDTVELRNLENMQKSGLNLKP